MPSAFVLDASVTLSWCFMDESTPHSQDVLDRLSDTYVETPAIWLFEVANVLMIGERRKRITAIVSDEFLQKLARLDIRVEPPGFNVSIHNLLTLTRRHGLTAYDAAYLELAQRKGLALATFDTNLRKAARVENVQLL
jgi:predicted nucleic acid-binding protein